MEIQTHGLGHFYPMRQISKPSVAISLPVRETTYQAIQNSLRTLISVELHTWPK